MTYLNTPLLIKNRLYAIPLVLFIFLPSGFCTSNTNDSKNSLEIYFMGGEIIQNDADIHNTSTCIGLGAEYSRLISFGTIYADAMYGKGNSHPVIGFDAGYILGYPLGITTPEIGLGYGYTSWNDNESTYSETSPIVKLRMIFFEHFKVEANGRFLESGLLVFKAGWQHLF